MRLICAILAFAGVLYAAPVYPAPTPEEPVTASSLPMGRIYMQKETFDGLPVTISIEEACEASMAFYNQYSPLIRSLLETSEALVEWFKDVINPVELGFLDATLESIRRACQ